MKKIINRKLYDTDTATLIGEWDNGAQCWSFDYITKELYKTPRGEYFLYIWGGATTAYAEPCCGGMGEGQTIEVLTKDEACEFAEKYLTADEYLSEFDLLEDEEKNSLPKLRHHIIKIIWDGENVHIADENTSESVYKPYNEQEFLEYCLKYVHKCLDPYMLYNCEVTKKGALLI